MLGFPQEFWTPSNIALIAATVILLSAGVGVVIYLLYITTLIALECRKPVNRETCVDELFGELMRINHGNCIGSWEGSVCFQLESTKQIKLAVSIEAGAGQPTAEQRELFRQIENRYSNMRPEIAISLANYEDSLLTVEKINRHIDDPSLLISSVVAGTPVKWSFGYIFDEEMDDLVYFVDFEDWKIVDVWASD